MADLFTTEPSGFVWASGIEDTFIPQTKPGMRSLDEYELTQHYSLWKSDFDLLAKTGVQAVRWGIPWYRIQPERQRWDWSWTDQALDYLVNQKGILPILDLMHYGTPLWMENSFIHPDYPQRVAEYAATVADRYKSLVKYYTPFNEPMVNADWAGRQGIWPPYLTGDEGYIRLSLAIARGITTTVNALKTVQPEMKTIQVEAFWRFRAYEEALIDRVNRNNDRQYISLDLTTGRMTENNHLSGFLLENGASHQDLDWFLEHCLDFDIIGANFYPWSYGRVFERSDSLYNRLSNTINGRVISDVITPAYIRYQTPIMVTETSAARDILGRSRWMDETLAAVRDLRTRGVPLVGYTWFPCFTMISWYYRTGNKPLGDYLLHLGLYDSAFNNQGVLERKRTSLVDQYRSHIAREMPFVLKGRRQDTD